jgi:alkylated DNA repair dioxygenase AlkB
VEAHARASFNSVLLNLYRDGQESVGWHSDDEREWGNEPIIASVSLGACREFQMRPTRSAGRTIEIPLYNGSLLVMARTTQRDWQHRIPKTALPVGERINLTFRLIHPKER